MMISAINLKKRHSASANAAAWFAGREDPQHTHSASLSGLKTKQLGESRNGQGGYNQLVFDDTPQQRRIELGTTEYQSRLQLGHLKQQTDNARQTDASGQTQRYEAEGNYQPVEVWFGESCWSIQSEVDESATPSPMDAQRYSEDEDLWSA